MPDRRPILVTGAAGCIGAWIVARLVERGLVPVVFDIVEDRRRLRLVMAAEAAEAVVWEQGDVADAAALRAVVERHAPQALIHLAALLIPACAADPARGAMVDVIGTINAFEAARLCGVRHLVYASSAAALTPEGHDGPTTLYGVYKAADEGIARLYAKDHGLASVGLRPHTVYGPGRDQGRTAEPTKAMLAAVAGRPYRMAYRGALRMQHVHEVADAFIAAALAEVEGAHVGDLQGVATTIDEVVALIRRHIPDADITVPETVEAFVVEQSDAALRKVVGDWPRVGLEQGVAMTIAAFRDLHARGLLAP